MGRPANLVVNILGNNSDLMRALNGSDSALGRLGGIAGTTMKGIATAWTGAVTAAGVLTADVFKQGVAFNTLNQTAGAAFKTILGSADAASQMMDDIGAFAKTSPFPKQAFITASQQMLGFGVEAKKVIPYLGAVQDAVAATGGSSTQLSEITFVMSQIQAAGKITGQDLMQFGQRGINAAELIGSQMGKTGAQIKADITSGSLDATAALDALAAGMSQKFGGAADNVKATWTGATDRIKGAIRDIGSVMAEPFISSAGGGMGVEWANAFADALRALEPIVAGVTSMLTGQFSGTLSMVGDILATVTGALKGVDIAGFTSSLADMLPALGAITGAFAAIAGGPLLSALPGIGPLFGSLSGPIGIVAAALAGLVAASPGLQELLGVMLVQAGQALAPILPILATAMQQLSVALGLVFQSLAPLIPVFAGALMQTIEALVPLVPVLGSVLSVVARAFTGIMSALAPLLPMLANLVAGVLAQLLPPLVQLGNALLPPLMQIVGAITPFIGQLVAAFMQLIPPVVEIVTALMPPLMKILGMVLDAVLPLLPVIGNLVGVLVDVAVKAVMPLLPVLVKLLDAFMPILTPVLKLVGVFGNLIEKLAPVISLIGELAGIIVGALASAIGNMIGRDLERIAPIFDAIADAIGWVVDKLADFMGWLGKIKIPDWLKNAGSWVGNLLGGAPPATLMATPGSFMLGAAPPTAGLRGLAGPLSAIGSPFAASSGMTFNVTVNAPYGGGDAIGRAVRAELVDFTRRRNGVVLGGQSRTGAVFA